MEVRDNARKYIKHLKTKFTAKTVKEIEKFCGKIATVRFGQQQALLVRKLTIRKEESERNRTTLKEAELYRRLVCQLVLTKEQCSTWRDY